MENIGRLGVTDRKDAGAVSAAAEMILEGLWAHSPHRTQRRARLLRRKNRANPSRAKRQIARRAASTTDA